jgi:hypothetical protein
MWIFWPEARPVTIDEAADLLDSPTEVVSDQTRPTPGVYENEGSGTESLSVPPLSQEQGPLIPATVELNGEDCWRYRVDYSTNHWQEWDYCRTELGLEETGGRSWARWSIGAIDFTNLSDFECDAGTPLMPNDREIGQEWPARCVGSGDAVDGESVSEGPYRFLGDEDLLIGGTETRVAHFLRERTMSGSQVGTEEAEVWIDIETGLPVKNERTIEVESDTPLGTSTYRDEGSYQLADLKPVS